MADILSITVRLRGEEKVELLEKLCFQPWYNQSQSGEYQQIGTLSEQTVVSPITYLQVQQDVDNPYVFYFWIGLHKVFTVNSHKISLVYGVSENVRQFIIKFKDVTIIFNDDMMLVDNY